MLPTASDWDYSAIQKENGPRVALLENAGSGEDLIELLEMQLATGFEKDIRYGVDFDGANPRVTIQFPVDPRIYDWFYNGRTGYRAHFWASSELGETYNRRLLVGFRSILEKRVAEGGVFGRKIAVRIDGASREETDEGSFQIAGALIDRSLDLKMSKVWLCERLIQTDGKQPCDLQPFYLAERYLPKLIIPKWTDAIYPKTGCTTSEGLRAPYSDEQGKSWLDIKGGFVGPRHVYQLKPPHKRAVSLHQCGWT